MYDLTPGVETFAGNVIMIMRVDYMPHAYEVVNLTTGEMPLLYDAMTATAHDVVTVAMYCAGAPTDSLGLDYND